MSTVTEGKPAKDAPKKKDARKNQRAIFDAPEKFEGELPVKKKGGRKSLLAPIVAKLQEDPGIWYKIASGKTGTVGQSRVRLMKLASEMGITIEAETHRVEGDDSNSDLFARFIAAA